MKAQTHEVNNTSFKTPIDSSIGNKSGEFQRIEDKYLIPMDQKNKVIGLLNQHMIPSYLLPDTKYTLIESLYFDSPHLDFFQHHFLPMETRYKMRIRKYAPNGIWAEGPCLLELKRKREGKSKKTRFMVSSEDLEKLKQGIPLVYNESLRQINSSIKEQTLEKRLNKINELLIQYDLRPVLSVQYHRLAFEKDGFRVTVDQQLTGKECAYFEPEFLKGLKNREDIWQKASLLLGKYRDNDKIIMEIKHQGFIPEWMVSLLQELKIEQSSFSKYCWFTLHRIQKVSASEPKN